MSKLDGVPFKQKAIGTLVVPFCPVCGLLFLKYLYNLLLNTKYLQEKAP